MTDRFREQGSVDAWQELNRRAAAEIKAGDGELRAPRVIYKRINPAKVVIGWMQRRMLRGEFKKRIA